MLSRERWRGGGDEGFLATSASWNLTDRERMALIVRSGAAGSAKIIMPYSIGLSLGTTILISLATNYSGKTIEFRNFADDANQPVYDKNGASQTSVDANNSTLWGSFPAVECRLINNALGLWTCFSRG